MPKCQGVSIVERRRTSNGGIFVIRVSSIGIVAALLALSVAIGLNRATAFQRGSPGALDGVEVLTRGPVHEAFAETITFDPEPGLVAPKAPPAPIEEAPPEQRPEGVNVAWIPGYWAWDDEGGQYLWVSGFWRAVPPGRVWVPGARRRRCSRRSLARPAPAIAARLPIA